MALKEIELNIPTDWSSVSLKKFLALQKDIKNYEGNDEAITALTFYHLCDIKPEWLKGLDVEAFNEIKTLLGNFVGDTKSELKRFVTIDGVEYGFEPNLSKMTYGAYADITGYKNIAIDENWAKIMNILYRPVTHKKGEMYNIEGYTGEDRSHKFLNVGMDVHFGALFFLLNLSMDLFNATLKSMKGAELPLNIKQILAKSGQHTQQSWNSLTGIYLK